MKRLLKIGRGICVAFWVLFFIAPVFAVGSDIKIAAFGDSLTAGYGLAKADGFAAALQKKLRANNLQVTVIDAGISGDTSGGALTRVDWMLRSKPQIVIVQFGANDMMRGVPISAMAKNLSAIVSRIQKTGARILLAGMESPHNYNIIYRQKFRGMYEDIADEYDVALYPFFLKDVALIPQLNLKDGVHPNAAGVRVIVDNVTPFVVDIIEDLH